VNLFVPKQPAEQIESAQWLVRPPEFDPDKTVAECSTRGAIASEGRYPNGFPRTRHSNNGSYGALAGNRCRFMRIRKNGSRKIVLEIPPHYVIRRQRIDAQQRSQRRGKRTKDPFEFVEGIRVDCIVPKVDAVQSCKLGGKVTVFPEPDYRRNYSACLEREPPLRLDILRFGRARPDDQQQPFSSRYCIANFLEKRKSTAFHGRFVPPDPNSASLQIVTQPDDEIGVIGSGI
jgi:hypothetical protein